MSLPEVFPAASRALLMKYPHSLSFSYGYDKGLVLQILLPPVVAELGCKEWDSCRQSEPLLWNRSPFVGAQPIV